MAKTTALVSVSPGALCPLDYPHAYNGGKDCCSSPWRDLIPGDSICDGGILQVADSCCPAGKSISCNIDSTYTCQTNPKYGKYREADNTSCTSDEVWKFQVTSVLQRTDTLARMVTSVPRQCGSRRRGMKVTATGPG